MDWVSNKWASLAAEPEPGQPTSSSSSSWMRRVISPTNVSRWTLVSMWMSVFSHPQTCPAIKACMCGADDHWDEKNSHAWTLSRNPELPEVRVENVHLDIWNKQLHQSVTMSWVRLNNWIPGALQTDGTFLWEFKRKIAFPGFGDGRQSESVDYPISQGSQQTRC